MPSITSVSNFKNALCPFSMLFRRNGYILKKASIPTVSPHLHRVHVLNAILSCFLLFCLNDKHQCQLLFLLTLFVLSTIDIFRPLLCQSFFQCFVKWNLHLFPFTIIFVYYLSVLGCSICCAF